MEGFRYVSIEELVTGILNGKRDFSRIRLEEGCDLSAHPQYREMLDYLKGQYLSEEPLNIEYSEFIAIKAKNLYLPYVIGKKARLIGANLEGANLREAYLEGAYLERANLREAYLEGAILWEAYLEGANLGGETL